ncbi:hypothetical protein EDF50_0975 [Frigoribacterium sp. PhB24]|nr:hypothetical protein EDF50_0975 [Frigoribacterium sp. PhB24]
MPTSTVTGQHTKTARMDIHQVADELVRGLGPTLVAALTGSRDRKLPAKWAKPDGPTPTVAFTQRLQLGHRAWATLVTDESAHIARQWFIGGNPLLGEDTPLTAIREDRGREVIEAVAAFLSDQPDA